MLEALTLTCEATDCDRSLDADSSAITMATPAGTRRAYECDCGAVTITVLRE